MAVAPGRADNGDGSLVCPLRASLLTLSLSSIRTVTGLLRLASLIDRTVSMNLSIYPITGSVSPLEMHFRKISTGSA